MPDLRPQLAFDPRGAGSAIWSYFEPHPRFVEDGYAVDYTFGLRVASRSTRGAFGKAQTLTDKLDADPSADAAFDGKGNAVVIWTDEAGMHAAARPFGKRRFGPRADHQPDPGPPTGDGRGQGRRDRGMVSEGVVRAAASDKGIAFGSAVAPRIPGLGKSKPVIGIDGRRAVTAAWSSRGRVMAATCGVSGHCGSARALSPAGENATDPRVQWQPTERPSSHGNRRPVSRRRSGRGTAASEAQAGWRRSATARVPPAWQSR